MLETTYLGDMEILEQYVSFETAKMLKEAGFDGLCQAFYYRARNGRRTLYLLSSIGYSDSPNEYLAPTQAMAARWLREVHNVHVQVEVHKSFHDTEKVIWIYDLYVKVNDCYVEREPWKNTDGVYYSYEECLEAGIQDAIKTFVLKAED